MNCCDNCATNLPNPAATYVFPSVPVPVASANAGESATLCRRCAVWVSCVVPEWFDIDQYRADNDN